MMKFVSMPFRRYTEYGSIRHTIDKNRKFAIMYLIRQPVRCHVHPLRCVIAKKPSQLPRQDGYFNAHEGDFSIATALERPFLFFKGNNRQKE